MVVYDIALTRTGLTNVHKHIINNSVIFAKHVSYGLYEHLGLMIINVYNLVIFFVGVYVFCYFANKISIIFPVKCETLIYSGIIK